MKKSNIIDIHIPSWMSDFGLNNDERVVLSYITGRLQYNPGVSVPIHTKDIAENANISEHLVNCITRKLQSMNLLQKQFNRNERVTYYKHN